MSDLQEASDTRTSHSSTPLQSSSREDLARVLDLSPDALMIVDQIGNIVMVNEQTEALFGYARSELPGQTLELLLPQRFREIHTGHREQYFASPRTRPMGIGLQLFGERKDGTEFPVDISLKPLLLDDTPHVLGAIRDVTQQRLAERERLLQVQHIRLQSELINQAHDAILVRDPIGRVLSWNRGAEQLYGWTEQEALGRIAPTLLKTHASISHATLDTVLEHEGQWEGELTHTRRDGS
ncbi:MAG: PAS domain S-box protein, partial [Ktedonobacteraceae bacterium]|nr:PAS domain S-box protein [Ktedonobacteraceae bacterium]